MDGKCLITYFYLCIIIICTILASCTDLTDVEKDIKDLQSKVTKLEDDRLFLDPDFLALVKQKWSTSKARFEAISGFIDAQAVLIKESAEANSQMWPINQTVNGDETMSFDDAVARMENVYQERIQCWIKQ